MENVRQDDGEADGGEQEEEEESVWLIRPAFGPPRRPGLALAAQLTQFS